METRSEEERISDISTIELEKLLKNVDFPANRSEIVDKLSKSGISPAILHEITMLPETEYSSADEVIKKFKKELSK